MEPAEQPRTSPAVRAHHARARLGASLFFFLNGFLISGLLTRLPEVKGLLALTEVEFGFIIAALPVGSIAAAALPAPLIRRFSAAAVASAGTAVLALVFTAAAAVAALGPGAEAGTGPGSGGPAAWAPAIPWIVAGLIALAGFLDAVVDAAQNVHGLIVEQARGTSIFNSLHAIWSVGSVTGGGLGLLASTLRIPLWAHLSVSGAIGVGLAMWAWRLSGPNPFPAVRTGPAPRKRTVIPDEDDSGETTDATGTSAAPGTSAEPGRSAADARPAAGTTGAEETGTPDTSVGDTAGGEAARPASSASGPDRSAVPSKWALLAGVIALGLLGAFVEDLGMNWSSLYFSEVGGVGVELAGIAFVVALTGQLIARFTADRLTDRIGRPGVVLSGGVCVTIGMLLAMGVAQPWAVVVGFFLSGYGSATFIPTAYAAAGMIPGFGHGMGITLASWALRVAMLGSSPLIGITAGALGLRYALVITVVAGLGAIVLAFTPVLRSVDTGRR